MIFELGADLFEFFGSEFQGFAMFPSFIKGKKMNMRVWNIGADDLPKSANAENFFHVDAEFFDSMHQSFVIFVGKFVDFIDF